MLSEFHLNNFVLIEDSTLTFTQGLNIISGETGAGKSLIATALGNVLGTSRFLTSQIRTGADQACLTAVFELPPSKLRKIEEIAGLSLSEAEEEGLILSRSLPREGRGRSTVNGKPVPLSILKAVGEIIIDIAAQDEHTALREPAVQREYLDLFGGHSKETVAAGKAWRRFRELFDQLRGGQEEKKRRQLELERLTHHIEELEELSPDVEQDRELEARISFLENAEEIRTFCDKAVEELYESDNSVISNLGSLAVEAEDLAGKVTEMAEANDSLQTSLAGLDDCVRVLRTILDSVEGDPAELDELGDRLFSLRDLSKKHGCEILELSHKLEELKDKREELSACFIDEEALKPAVEEAAAEFTRSGEELKEKRKKTGKKLSREVKKHLSALGMEKADFKVTQIPLLRGNPKPEELYSLASANGTYDTSYEIRPNPGEAWGNLNETASGGETTRAMLAVKSALTRVVSKQVLFFDEIDAGVGGRLGEAIAEQLLSLAEKHQVIAITHLPQIAGKGHNHLVVRKATAKGRTRTEVVTLAPEERVDEIAGMIRGSKATEITRQQAREMLA